MSINSDPPQTLSRKKIDEAENYVRRGMIDSEMASRIEAAKKLLSKVDQNGDGLVRYAEKEYNDPLTESEDVSMFDAPAVIVIDARYPEPTDNPYEQTPPDYNQKSELKKFTENIFKDKAGLDRLQFNILAKKYGFDKVVRFEDIDKTSLEIQNPKHVDSLEFLTQHFDKMFGDRTVVTGKELGSILPAGFGAVIETETVIKGHPDQIVSVKEYSKEEAIQLLYKYNRSIPSVIHEDGPDGKVSETELFKGLSELLKDVDDKVSDGRRQGYINIIAEADASNYEKLPDMRTDAQKEAGVKEILNELDGTRAKPFNNQDYPQEPSFPQNIDAPLPTPISDDN